VVVGKSPGAAVTTVRCRRATDSDCVQPAAHFPIWVRHWDAIHGGVTPAPRASAACRPAKVTSREAKKLRFATGGNRPN
jgi:hypothetical protein